MYSNQPFKFTMSVLSLIVAALFVLGYFMYRDIRNKNEHISNLEQRLSLKSDKQSYLISTQTVLQNSKPDISRIENSIISKDGDVRFIENIESLARNSGLSITIDSLNSSDISEAVSGEVVGLKIKAKTEGNWAGTYRFLAELESLPVKVKIDRFGLSNTGSQAITTSKISNSGNSWQSNFEIFVLKYK